MSIYKKLSAIQAELNAPKNQTNTFGKYKYRSCEDILSALKEHIKKHNVSVTLNDDVVMIADDVYIKATATIFDEDGESVSVTSFAREPEDKKGMDVAQITGASSSYARKYALNGLFCIDDTKDADATNDHGKKQVAKKETVKKENPVIKQVKESLANLKTLEELEAKRNSEATKTFISNQDVDVQNEIIELMNRRYKELDKSIKTEEVVGAGQEDFHEYGDR